MTARKRGRPPKLRPELGTPLTRGMSRRDISAAIGMTRREIEECLALASIPKDEFNALLERDEVPSIRQLVLLARRRAGKSTERERRCPNCDWLLRIEDAL